MLVVLSKAIAFVLIILIGYICKRRGVFAPTDYQLVSKIVLNITLPCAVISSFAHFQLDLSLLAAVALGLSGNCVMIFFALMLTRRETLAAKIFYIFSLAGYNIGTCNYRHRIKQACQLHIAAQLLHENRPDNRTRRHKRQSNNVIDLLLKRCKINKCPCTHQRNQVTHAEQLLDITNSFLIQLDFKHHANHQHT